MIKAPIGKNEAERLQALLDYKILDTKEDVAFDQLVEMASKICDVPIALVSLIDSDRQWFKANVGLDAKETPRDISFCGHAIHQKDIFIINEPSLDERFKGNPLTTGYPHIRFYAGTPLITPEGHAIGTLCVIDQKPRELSEDQKRFLKILSEQVIAQLELKKSLDETKKNIKELQEVTKIVLEQKKELIRSEKLATIGKIAAGVSHEINNPLAIICGKVSLAIDMVEAGQPKEKILPLLTKVDATADRISQIVQALNTFSRNNFGALKTTCSLNDIIEDCLVSFQDKIEANGIFLDLNLKENVTIEADPTQVYESLSHLISNSIDAMELSLSKKLSIELSHNSEKAFIRVSDTGHGIEDAILDSIMEPFFTTKDVGKGKGLGLSIAKNLIEAHEGLITIEKNRHPTIFQVLLPKR